MNLLDAHGLFALRPSWAASLLPLDLEPVRPNGVDTAPAIMTAAVLLSGELDECRTEEDLVAAVEHFGTCLSAGIFTVEQLNDEAVSIIRLVIAEMGRHKQAAL